MNLGFQIILYEIEIYLCKKQLFALPKQVYFKLNDVLY